MTGKPTAPIVTVHPAGMRPLRVPHRPPVLEHGVFVPAADAHLHIGDIVVRNLGAVQAGLLPNIADEFPVWRKQAQARMSLLAELERTGDFWPVPSGDFDTDESVRTAHYAVELASYERDLWLTEALDAGHVYAACALFRLRHEQENPADAAGGVRRRAMVEFWTRMRAERLRHGFDWPTPRA